MKIRTNCCERKPYRSFCQEISPKERFLRSKMTFGDFDKIKESIQNRVGSKE